MKISVIDKGLGISKEKQKQLFKPFVQLHKKELRTAGTGLGLYISQKIITTMEGKIGLESEENQGSTF